MSTIGRALQGFSYGYRAGGKVGGLLGRRRARAEGWAARILAEQRSAQRAASLQQLGGTLKRIGGWAAVLASIGAVVLTTMKGDEVSEFLTGHKSA